MHRCLPAEIACARLAPGTMMVASVLSATIQAAARPAESLRPVLEKLLQVALQLNLKHVLMLWDFIFEDPTPPDHLFQVVVPRVPGDEFEAALMHAAVLAGTVFIIPDRRAMASWFVVRPVFTLASGALGRGSSIATCRGACSGKTLTQYSGPLQRPHRLRSFPGNSLRHEKQLEDW